MKPPASRASVGSSLSYVADDQVVCIAAAGRVGRQPVDQRLSRQRAGHVTVAGAVAQVEIAQVVAIRAFRFQVVDDHREDAASAVVHVGLRQRRTVLGIDEVGINGGVEDRVSADQRD